MNQYGWGTMMNDYTFLEEMAREVATSGATIVKGGYASQQALPMRRGKGPSGPKTKRDLLKTQLDIRDIDMDILPNGMERRKLNQSAWDFKYVLQAVTPIHKPMSLENKPRSSPSNSSFIIPSILCDRKP